MTSLPELLEGAKTGAPPPRYGVDDIVAAGKRRRRRRNTEWAIAAAAVVLAAVIGVPQILTRADGGPPVLPAVPDGPAPSVSPSGLAFAFHGYRTGSYEISEATWMYRDRTGARIYRAGTQEEVGQLDLYQRGVEPVEGTKLGYHQDVLIWKYATDAYAVLTAGAGSPLTESDMRQLADGFALGNGRPVRVAYKVGYIPAGYRVQDVLAQPGAEINTSNVTLRTEQGDGEIKFRIANHQGSWTGDALKPYCTESCMRPMTDNRYLYISGSVPPAEIRKIFDSTAVAPSLDSDADWFPLGEAFPTSAGFTAK